MGLTQRRIDAKSTPVSQAVIEAVAESDGVDVTDVEPPEYEPLYSVVDPEGLDTLFEPTLGGETRSAGTVTFEYAGYDVTVYGDGRIELDHQSG